MKYRIYAFILLVGLMILIYSCDVFSHGDNLSDTLILGFLLLTGYLTGHFVSWIRLPRITGYMLAGLLLGPAFLNYLDLYSLDNLYFLNHLALAYIAFCAGGELKLEEIKQSIRTISFMLTGITLIVFCGVTLSVMLLSPLIPFLKDAPLAVTLAVACLIGIISTARSPSSAIAVISETGAKGQFTNIILSVTVAMDVVVIVLFAVTISFCQLLIDPHETMDVLFILLLVAELLLAIVLGFLLGNGIIFLIDTLGVELPVVIAGMGFFVIKFCHFLGEYLYETHDISLELEPLLICITAGFTVQNLSRHGRRFLESLDRVSMPIYVAFFAITGATINIEILKTTWFLGFVIVASRCIMLFIGGYLSGKLAGTTNLISRNAWLGFITQAGVSLGLAAEVARRFPQLGGHVQSIIISTITVNQIIGPVMFKYVLFKVGDARTEGNKS